MPSLSHQLSGVEGERYFLNSSRIIPANTQNCRVHLSSDYVLRLVDGVFLSFFRKVLCFSLLTFQSADATFQLMFNC